METIKATERPTSPAAARACSCNATLVTRCCLVFVSLLDIIPGMVHCFAPDGGAGSIAGIVLEWENSTSIQVGGQNFNTSSYHKQSILVMFNALGVSQIKLGIVIMLMALGLPQGAGGEGVMLCRLTWILMIFQVLIIIGSATGSRNIHSVASSAPGGYKVYAMAIVYVIATVAQVIWYRDRKEYTR